MTRRLICKEKAKDKAEAADADARAAKDWAQVVNVYAQPAALARHINKLSLVTK